MTHAMLLRTRFDSLNDAIRVVVTSRRSRASHRRRGGLDAEGDHRDPVRRHQLGQEGRHRQVRSVLHPVEAVRRRRRIRQDLQERGDQQQPEPRLEEVHHHVSH